mmetsp:Transcript_35119/g.25581  ORF Transcript_35119/g.25581 Transcript_35119/m.25581 type:complete len:81 (+) Transcript_35119:1046-1288(+)|eukprot:CAMPEP_0116872516 /NCGR_PEP_ID=MMETSP0463-20121206/3286_1 /TAXON_ID=181622 /ORGANISM="Strombidinopsis sp, Strain SopsisLIS2011" /LENGTH=80 /DNA_ID=CAMNT_0004512855 /DNA_START=1038 /DNA_END=1280 /DNA_ORIENTATION=+
MKKKSINLGGNLMSKKSSNNEFQEAVQFKPRDQLHAAFENKNKVKNVSFEQPNNNSAENNANGIYAKFHTKDTSSIDVKH